MITANRGEQRWADPLDVITQAIESLGHERISRKAGIYLCHKYSGANLKEIGECFGIGESAVSQASRRFMVEMERDQELRTLVDKIGAKLGLSKV